MTQYDETYTEFLPAQRAPAPRLAEQGQAVSRSPMLPFLMDAVAEAVVILNDCRQIVYANQAFLEIVPDPARVIGLRPGEALSCRRAEDSIGGCGTTRFCRACGASKAIVGAQKGHRRIEECRIMRSESASEKALDLRVVATPFRHEGHDFIIFAITDIAAEKRRQALEHIFLHDVGNTASVIHGAADLIAEMKPEVPEQVPELVRLLNVASNRLISEIEAQKELADAESGDLVPQPTRFSAGAVLHEIATITNGNGTAGCHLVVEPGATDLFFESDRRLLGRVLGNMTKNALEATPALQTVTLGSRSLPDGIQFWVHNPTAMPESVQLQVFQRSFSTKGQGRGLGTYGMRLLTERYLGGQVGFSSTKSAGTTFWANLPLTLPAAADA